ncbi:MAG: RagB/SusD family nutrient uptake outer membrane protein [Prevotella sp.]|nr:RagB/SusD family nutrient uptake outer membrane protein [Prevotella sp.]
MDTVILPDDKTVDEDFWKSKADVQLMVNGAYRSMLSPDIIKRIIVWSGLRSEEMIPLDNISGSLAEDLTEINLGNIQPDNEFARWSAFYHVINNCNLVLAKAAGAMDEDPMYTEGDYLSDCSQMLALRALCYFYLVRNFRDVPLVTEAFMNSSQDRNVPQVAPDSVLERCIEDLKTAEVNAISASAFNDWRRVGYFTRDAIQTLLADIYLWRGSVMHSAADYQACVDYCNKVIDSKKNQHVFGWGEARVEKDFYLAEGREAFDELYVNQNAEESIFELQYNGNDYYSSRSEGNSALCQYYCSYNSGSDPYLFASSLFLNGGTVYTSDAGSYRSQDWRGLVNTYNLTKTVGSFDGLEIRKYVGGTEEARNAGDYNIISSTRYAKKDRAFSWQYTQNFIIYRLTDVMLMKAEALVALSALADDNADSRLYEAFYLTQTVNARSKTNDSIMWSAKSSVGYNGMEKFVLEERLREFAFEGKRWYDLLRYNYRHVEGVEYSKTLAELDDEGITPVDNYNNNEIMNLAVRKLVNGNAVAAKLSNENTLYLPIPLSDINVCPVLRQNPAYSSDDKYSKNY